MPFLRRTVSFGALLLVAPLLVGCSEDARLSGTDDRLLVAASTAQLTSIVTAVGRERVDVRRVLPADADPTGYEPDAEDLDLLRTADLVLLNGLGLEPSLAAAAERVARDPEDGVALVGDEAVPEEERIVPVAPDGTDGTDATDTTDGTAAPNPHPWTAPEHAKAYADVVAAHLAAHDPGNAAFFAQNTKTFREKVDELAAALLTDAATVPEDARRIEGSDHPYAYLADVLGWELVPADRRPGTGPAAPGLPGSPGDPEHSWPGLARLAWAELVESHGGTASTLRRVPLEGQSDVDATLTG